jgi:alpha-1,2-mannosyltransferase
VDYVAFFHPFCDSGGGGERVLWNAAKAILDEYPQKHLIIYCWEGCQTEDVVPNVKKHFGIDLNSRRVVFLKLTTWKFLESHRYKFLTLIMSSIGSMVTGWEAVMLLKPKVVIESVGFSFIYPIFWLFGAKVITYVHYPTISSDMLRVIQQRTVSFNNSSVIAKSRLLSQLKLSYYQLFAKLYGFMGRFATVVMVNSSWTAGHIQEIWKIPNRTFIVYPPCDTSSLMEFPLENRNRTLISVAQFRPEKDHFFQIRVFENLLKKYPKLKNGPKSVKLVFIGGVRNNQDALRVADIRKLITECGLENSIHIVENASYPELLRYLESCLIGLHAMKDEHFGISIIEYMVNCIN